MVKESGKTSPVCSNCKTQDTSLWRKDQNNTYSCNACGLYYRIYKRNRPSKYRSATYRSGKRSQRMDNSSLGCVAPACGALCDDMCSSGDMSSSFFQDPYMFNDIVTIDWNQPLIEEKAEPSKSSDVAVGTSFDAFGKEGKNKSGEEKHCMPEHKDAKDVKTKRSNENMRIDEEHELFNKTYEEEEKVFAYKTGTSFHIGKYLHTSSHSAGVSQTSYASRFTQGPNCFRTFQNSHHSYTNVSGGIEFPKIKMVPVDFFRFKHRERRRSLLNEEEMEAAEALADFAYRVRHGGCN